MKKFNLLIHHHAVAFQDEHKDVHLPSFIGRWVNALAEHVDQIGLVLHTSGMRSSQQDEIIRKPNVKLWDLGPAGKTWDRIPRMRRLRHVCRQASLNADGLLIRGVTPRQMDVWNNVRVSRKAFLLVGSLLQTQPVFKPTFWGVYEAVMRGWRRMEVLKMTRDDILLANSPDLVDELKRLDRRASFVPTNSIWLNEFATFHVRAPSDPRTILFCGRVVPEKGIRELIHALARVNISRASVLDIVGPVDSLFRQELDHLANELGVIQNIRWHGHVRFGPELMSFYRKADAFVLPTYYEGFPHVIWEAAANCCPVIVSRVGGIPSLWRDGEHGMLIAPKSPDAIVQALETLFDHDALRTRLVEKAYTHARNFAVEACAIRLAATLREHGWVL
jgi:glycosyltransferase involved in cell wall biosynthesis